ncbi:SDR family oxidoreductase [Tahibacter amnicola]|uniref:SDR family oxidoreductase n=1 Tax=Tahibacter amnicola TaxID=2976241 RepID=A0ABY6BKW5_9GAMM|nr:SDR family oxidoreductase [Tahibacter amnicola]UXI68442.1 SDR family oxidoreductase [Tahibacter amnicola]
MGIAVVTGANRGLGLEFVHQLLARRWRVVAACRKPAGALTLTALAGAHPGHLHALALDVAREKSIQAFVHELGLVCGHVDLLINNAGVLKAGERLGQVDAQSLTDSFVTNAAAPLLLVQALMPFLEKAANARIANISSQIASLAQTTAFRTPSYAMSKAALNMATRLLAAELAPRGISVGAFHPGWVHTDMGGAKAPLSAAESVAQLLPRMLDLTPGDAGRFISYDGTELPW